MRLPPARKASVEPLGQALSGCSLQPAPGLLNQQRSRPPVARLADALLDLAVTAGIGVGANPTQPASSRRLANSRQPNSSLTSTQAPLGPMARSWISCATSGCLPSSTPGAASSSSALICCLTSCQPRALALDLGAQQRRHLRAVAFPPGSPVAPADDDVRSQVVQHQQRADAVGVRNALVHQSSPVRGACGARLQPRRVGSRSTDHTRSPAW